MREAVIKIGGFAFPRPHEAGLGLLEGLASVVKRLVREGFRLAVVVGGGPLARDMIALARSVGASEPLCDELGMMASRCNAYLFSLVLDPASRPDIPSDFPSLAEALASRQLVVVGGLHPGQSTDTVAVLAAELLGAGMVVKATDVDGIYTSDPKKDPGAVRLPRLTYDDALELLSRMPARAGAYELLDLQAIRLARRSGIRIRVVDGREPENVYKAVRGEELGSLVGP